MQLSLVCKSHFLEYAGLISMLPPVLNYCPSAQPDKKRLTILLMRGSFRSEELIIVEYNVFIVCNLSFLS